MNDTENTGVVVIGRARITNKGKTLFLQRSSHTKIEPLCWELPGGKLKKYESVEACVEREVFEETSLEVRVISSDYKVSTIIVDYGMYTGVTFINLIAEAVLIKGSVKLGSEHSNYGWFTPSEAKKLDLADYIKRDIFRIL